MKHHHDLAAHVRGDHLMITGLIDHTRSSQRSRMSSAGHCHAQAHPEYGEHRYELTPTKRHLDLPIPQSPILRIRPVHVACVVDAQAAADLDIFGYHLADPVQFRNDAMHVETRSIRAAPIDDDGHLGPERLLAWHVICSCRTIAEQCDSATSIVGHRRGWSCLLGSHAARASHAACTILGRRCRPRHVWQWPVSVLWAGSSWRDPRTPEDLPRLLGKWLGNTDTGLDANP